MRLDRERAGPVVLGHDGQELRLHPVAHGVADHPLVFGQQALEAVVVDAAELLHDRYPLSRTGLKSVS